jgi:hypothetical protein
MNIVDINIRVKELVQTQIKAKGYVCMIDILLGLEYLSKKDLDAWRFGKIEYLEKVCMVNLSKITSIYKMLKSHALELKLSPSYTGYNRFGNGLPQNLRFSKSGDNRIEENYSTHYIDKEYFKEKIKKVCV